jgi:hypothetical protein
MYVLSQDDNSGGIDIVYGGATELVWKGSIFAGYSWAVTNRRRDGLVGLKHTARADG